LASAVGRDAAAIEMRRCLADEGIEASLVEDAARATTLKTRVLARAQQVVRVDRETGGPLDGDRAEELRAQILDTIESVDAVVISDYDKGVVTRSLLESLLPAARRRGLPVVVDPKLPNFFAYQPITIVTPNVSEAARVTAMEIRSDEACFAAATSILERLDTHAVLVTRGERGMLLLERGHAPEFIPAVARQVYDVTGAGDTVVAVIALALAAGARIAEAAVLANHAGGVVVGKVGTATVRGAEILDHMDVRA
jgi:D-beta-D-heptose 7-phosphate kinase/D-beta-D-heptose 1-phosphate adenosyltransferase